MTSLDGASKAASTRASIAAAAADSVARSGVQGVRVEEVADVAGVSTGLLYYHFGNRQGLVLAGLIEALRHESEAEPVLDADGSVSRIEAELERYLDIDTTEHPGARVRADGLRAAVFEEDVRGPVARSTAMWEMRLAANNLVQGGCGASVSALSALVDGLRLRVASGVLDADAARALLQAALVTLLPAPVQHG